MNVKLDLNDKQLIHEVQVSLLARMPGRYGKPLVIDRVFYDDTSVNNLPNSGKVVIYYYEDKNHQKQGSGFQPHPIRASIDEFKYLKRVVDLHKLKIA